jgi:hypothetical protein
MNCLKHKLVVADMSRHYDASFLVCAMLHPAGVRRVRSLPLYETHLVVLHSDDEDETMKFAKRDAHYAHAKDAT